MTTDHTWTETCRVLSACSDCRGLGLLHDKARPLFGRFKPQQQGVLFVFEAPNLSDTTDPAKGYITYDTDAEVTDPTGVFTRDLFTQVLRLTPETFQVTNAVLCLPAKGGDGKFTVRQKQVITCSDKLRWQITTLDPIVVVSVGATAFSALRRIDDHGSRALRDSIGRGHRWFGRWLFPLAHTSRLGRVNRPQEQQLEDWNALSEFLVEHDITTRLSLG